MKHKHTIHVLYTANDWLFINPLKDRGGNWLHFAIQV